MPVVDNDVLSKVTSAVTRTLKARHGAAIAVATEAMQLLGKAISAMKEAGAITPPAMGQMAKATKLMQKLSGDLTMRKSMSEDEFEGYALEQMSKVSGDAVEVASERLAHLAKTIEIAKSSFADGATETAEIEMFKEPKVDRSIDPVEAAALSDDTGFAGNPSQAKAEDEDDEPAPAEAAPAEAPADAPATAPADAPVDASADAPAPAEAPAEAPADAPEAPAAEAPAEAPADAPAEAPAAPVAASAGDGEADVTKTGEAVPWPMDLNTKDFREGVSKTEDPSWGYDAPLAD